MTAKEFFKSKAFKSILVLLCVLLISGVFLTIMYGFFEVTDEERFNRKVGNLYPDGSSVTPTLQVETETKVGDSTVEKVWFIPEKGDYLVQVYGPGRDGKITVWAIIKTSNGAVSGVGTVLVYDKIASEYAYKISGWNTNISNFEKDYVDGIKYDYGNVESPSYINTGASTSFTAISKCVNDAITYIQAYVSGGSLEAPPYENFLYNEYIDQNETTISVDGDKVTYTIKTQKYGDAAAFTIEIVVDSDKKIESFEIKTNGSTEDGHGVNYSDRMPDLENILVGKDISYFTTLYDEDMTYKAIASYDEGSVTTGATTEDIASKSTYLCMYAGAFATANYENALLQGLKYSDSLDMDNTDWTVADGKVTYTIKTQNYGDAAAFTIEIVVDSDKKIESFEIKTNGSTEDGHGVNYSDRMPDLENILVGKDISYFTTLYDEDMTYKAIASYDEGSVTTGATTEDIASKSTYLCMYAGAFATANYDVALLTGGNA